MVDMMLRRESYGFLVTNVIKNFEEKQNLERLIFDLQTLQAVSDTEVQSMLDWEQKLMLSRVISEHLRPMRASQRARWLDKKIVFDSLTSDDLTELVMQTIRSSISRNAPLAHIAEQTQHFMNRYDLKDERPETYAELRSLIAEHFQVQPSEISTVFPDDERSITEQASEYSGHIRGMSALVNLARKQSPEDQLELIEFLMGRQQETPGFVFEITKYGDEKLDPEQLQSVINLLATVRFRLENQREDRRAFVVNSILTGGSPLISDPEQNQLLRNRILGHVSEDKKPMANLIIDALTRAEGTTISLYYSYALAQKPSGEDKVLSEADVFQALLIPFEVPGIKLMQYLGFSKTFEEYSESFEEAQDNANPLNYYDALNLVALRYGEKWADNHIITDMKGFGSVNVALSYYNIETGETGEITFAREEIVNLARKDIRIRSKEAFRRFKAALEALIELQEHDGQFDMLVGLLQLIEDSVALEFDKENFVEMQNNAGSIYSGPATRGWTLKTVPVFDRFELSVRMGMAKGRPAKKVERENPELYAEAMTAFLMAEFEHLIGGSDVDDKLMFANPDIHNGQLFIDEESRTVTVIDFGQATSINDQQRRLAIDMLNFLTVGAGMSTEAKDSFEKWAVELGFENYQGVSVSELNQVLSGSSRMDRFVYLASLLNRKGFKLPLAVSNWIQAANRLIVLGDKIDHSMESYFTSLVLAQRFSHDNGLKHYRSIHKAGQSIRSGVVGLFTGWGEQNQAEEDAADNNPTIESTDNICRRHLRALGAR